METGKRTYQMSGLQKKFNLICVLVREERQENKRRIMKTQNDAFEFTLRKSFVKLTDKSKQKSEITSLNIETLQKRYFSVNRNVLTFTWFSLMTMLTAKRSAFFHFRIFFLYFCRGLKNLPNQSLHFST